MAKGEGTVAIVVRFPFPWPPSVCRVVHASTHEETAVEIIATTVGRLALRIADTTGPQLASLISRQIEVHGPYSASMMVIWGPSGCRLLINGEDVLNASPTAPSYIVPPPASPISAIRAVDDPRASESCKQWIDNRKLKFGAVPRPRKNRRLKSLNEEAQDLRNSVLRLRSLEEQIVAGKKFMLGTLVGEMRAAVYWPPSRPIQPDDSWNPILLRMASKADLPLPVYFVPRPSVQPPIIASAYRQLLPDPPRLDSRFSTDQIADLQQVLNETSARLGEAPGRTIVAVDLIKEMAHTMGAAHYDPDASDFVEVFHAANSFNGTLLEMFFCQTAKLIADLSDWVLVELKTRNLIA